MKHIAELVGLRIIRILNFFYPLFRAFLPQETYRYAVTGGMNLLLDIFLYFVFYHFVVQEADVKLWIVTTSPHIAAFIFVFPITFSNGFLLAKYVTFTESKLQGRKQLVRYGISVGGSILLNYILLKLFVEIFNIYPTPSKMITTAIVVVYSFLIQKFFTFKTGKKQIARTEPES